MMYSSSKDMLGFVDVIGQKLNTIPAKWMRTRGPLPQAKLALGWQRTFNDVHARFSSGDYRHTDIEAGQIAELAQWLINMDREMKGQPPRQLTVHMENLVEREVIIG
jgi:hypothetical protein